MLSFGHCPNTSPLSRNCLPKTQSFRDWGFWTLPSLCSLLSSYFSINNISMTFFSLTTKSLANLETQRRTPGSRFRIMSMTISMMKFTTTMMMMMMVMMVMMIMVMMMMAYRQILQMMMVKIKIVMIQIWWIKDYLRNSFLGESRAAFKCSGQLNNLTSSSSSSFSSASSSSSS